MNNEFFGPNPLGYYVDDLIMYMKHNKASLQEPTIQKLTTAIEKLKEADLYLTRCDEFLSGYVNEKNFNVKIEKLTTILEKSIENYKKELAK